MTKELRSIPFDVCYQIYKDAADIAAETAEAENLERYEAYLAQLEQQWSDTHEAPYEGNFSDEVPYQPHPQLLQIRRRAGQAAVISEFIPRYKLDTIMQAWVMPQIIAWLCRVPFPLTEVGNGESPDSPQFRVNGLKVLNLVFDPKSEWDMGLYQFLMMDSRSSWVKSQYKPEGRTYCSLVPLILYAFKLNRGIKYSQWDRGSLKWVVNTSLCEAMLCEVPEDITRDDILEAREQGLIYKSGTKVGQSRNPVSTFKLYDTAGTKLHKLPELAKTMLAQIWCAHPENRTKYMVLDPRNWDSIPSPLISADNLFHSASATSSVKKFVAPANMPWL